MKKSDLHKLIKEIITELNTSYNPDVGDPIIGKKGNKQVNGTVTAIEGKWIYVDGLKINNDEGWEWSLKMYNIPDDPTVIPGSKTR